MKHLRYLRYIILNKWFVMLACFRLAKLHPGLYWRGIIHDWSKFLPSEWFAYANFFYGGPKKPDVDERSMLGILAIDKWECEGRAHIGKRGGAIDIAWLRHQHRNSHHWQYWILKEDDGRLKALEMPYLDMLEMLADWEGAGRAIAATTGKVGTLKDWYVRSRSDMVMHPRTQHLVDKAIGWTNEDDCPF